MVKNVILGFLMYKNLTGYEIKQIMSHSTSNFMNSSFGSIYPALKQLEKKGLISYTNSIEKGKYKKIYEINKKGKEEFIQWLQEPINFMKSFEEILSKVFFYRYLSVNQSIELINRLIEDINHKLDNLDDLKIKIQDDAGFYEFSTLRFGIDHLKFIKNWYQQFLNEMKERNKV